MPEAEKSIAIDASIEDVWAYVRDIRKWANLFPGCNDCVVLDENNSRWSIKVGAGGLVRTVNVLVHVDEWSGPERVNFSYKLDGDPVVGGGYYLAARKGPRTTEITLQVRVQGSGPMAPMWEAMSRPLLPQLAQSFASKLKTEIEKCTGGPTTTAATPVSKPAAGLIDRLKKRWRSIFASSRTHA